MYFAKIKSFASAFKSKNYNKTKINLENDMYTFFLIYLSYNLYRCNRYVRVIKTFRLISKVRYLMSKMTLKTFKNNTINMAFGERFNYKINHYFISLNISQRHLHSPDLTVS